MHCYSARVIRMLNILAVILLTSYLGAPAHAGEMVPLKGTFLCEVISPDFSTICQGHATHLGQNVAFVDGPTGTATLVASNGDTITTATTDFALGNEISFGIFLFIQEITITGGTGRFSNAVGSATLTGTVNFIIGEFEGFTNGTISRPNSR